MIFSWQAFDTAIQELELVNHVSTEHHASDYRGSPYEYLQFLQHPNDVYGDNHTAIISLRDKWISSYGTLWQGDIGFRVYKGTVEIITHKVCLP